jgi:PKD repeat protein
MVARFSRFLTLTAVAALVVVSCTRETPMQPLRPDVMAQDTSPPDTLAPPNDNIANATFASPLPFADSIDLTHASVEAGEPASSCRDSSLGPASRSVWYSHVSHQSGTVHLTAQTFGGQSVLTVYFDSTGLGLLEVGCNVSENVVGFNADSGLTYYFQVSDYFDSNQTVFFLQQDSGPPPPPPPPPPSGNDNFADAELAPGIPFTATAVFDSATREPSEPAFCFFQARTVWYRFTPTETQAVTASVQASFSFDGLTVYQGTSLNNLSFVRCTSSFGGTASFTAVAGQTYYFQVGSDQPGTATFSLQQPPPPQAGFFTQPFDPSSFDLVQFYDQSYDPGGIGIQSWQWDFGDGATATDPFPTHRYAADGDYLVRLTVTTFDGRTGSTSRTLQVRTHDVAITRFATPASGQTGKTTKISVDIRSNRLPETVQVQFYKSVPGGFQLVAVSEQTLPTRNRVTSVGFSYTFTADDAIIGKVTFRAVALLVNARDALPADNEAIGSPTKVTR